jgi:hypothetical protein
MSDLLHATHLTSAEWEAIDPAELGETEFTLLNAVERLRRIAYHKARIAEVDEQESALAKPFLEEIERIRAWGCDERRAPTNSIAHHESWLRRHYELNPPAKGKTIKLPNGEVSMKDQPPKWTYPNDEDFTKWLAEVRPDLTKTETVTTYDKVALKQNSTVRDGVPFIEVEGGELLMLRGAKVETVPAKFTVKTRD